MNILLSKQYAIHNPKGEAYKEWLKSHTPFHWFVEFYGIMNEGGFNVIIGNPPYVKYSKVKKEYQVSNYAQKNAAICMRTLWRGQSNYLTQKVYCESLFQ